MRCDAVVLAVSAIGTKIKEREREFLSVCVPFLVIACGKERGVEPCGTLTAPLLGRAIAGFLFVGCSPHAEVCNSHPYLHKLLSIILLVE